MDKSGAKVQLLEVQAVWAEQSSGTHWNIESLKGKKNQVITTGILYDKRSCSTLNGRLGSLTF